jgi:hypothetical protein
MTNQFAKGTATSKGSCKIFFGDAQAVEAKVLAENTKYRSIYYYESSDEMFQKVTEDRQYFGEDVLGVELIQV